MTERNLLNLSRSLLRDTPRGMATAARFYDDEVIVRQLNVAQQEVAAALILHAPRADITVCRLLKSVVVTPGFPGSDLPDDFWIIEAGSLDAGGGRVRYVPGVSIAMGDQTQFFARDKVYAKGGKLWGQAELLYYWRLPSEIGTSNRTLTDFPDAFYHEVKIKACADLVAQEDHDALDRWKALQKDFEQSVVTLK